MCRGSESGTGFKDISLAEGEWYDYDEKAGSSVSITEIETRCIKVK